MNLKKQIITVILLSAVMIPSADSLSEITRQKKQQIADRLYDIELSGGDQLGYSREILQHLEKSANIRPGKYKSNSFDDIDRLNESGKTIDFYSLFSGGLAIRESLQLESIRPSDEGMRDINPTILNLINIESNPYEKMLSRRNFKIYPVDKCVPEEFYYIHFTDALKAFNFFNFIDETGGAVYKHFSQASVDFLVKEKLLTQLAVRETSDIPAFYTNSMSEIIITGSDPFVNEGSDVTLIIQPAAGPLFIRGISGMRKMIKDRYSAKEKDIDVSGYKGNHIYTDDRQVWSIFLTLSDGTAIISNSIKAAEKIADTFSGKIPALSDAPDYKYMRSIYPAGAINEDGLVYLSEKFIRYLISPQLRIKKSRRMYDSMKLSVLEKYIIFHYQLTGAFPQSIEEVMNTAGGPSITDPRKKELESIKHSPFYNRASKLSQDEISNWTSFRSAISVSSPKKTKERKKKKQSISQDDFIYDLKLFYKKLTGQQAYTPAEVLGIIETVSKPGGLDSTRFRGLTMTPGSFSVKSDIYGKTNYMIPLIEIETGNISQREAEEYKKFAESCSSFWKDYFNPVGIRIKTAPVFSAETCILPLKNSSIYSLLTGITGGTPIELHPDSKMKSDTLSMAFKINPLMINSYLTLAGLGDAQILKSISKPEDIFTGELQFHMGDTLPLADFDSSILSDFFTDSFIRSSEVLTGFLAWSLFHPLRIALPVKKPHDGMILINSIINKLVERGSFNNFVQSESYLSSYNKTDLLVVKLTFFSSLITRIYIAEKDNVLNIATTEKYIKEILDVKPGTNNTSVTGNASLVVRPSSMILEHDTYRAGMIENGLQKSRKNSGTIKLMGMIFPDADSKDIPDLTYKNFGFKPVCPLGGSYIYDRKTGNVMNTVYGSVDSPILKIDENSNGAVPLYLNKFFKSSELRVDLEFTPEGIRTKIQGK